MPVLAGPTGTQREAFGLLGAPVPLALTCQDTNLAQAQTAG
jgi:hypothetical protein